MAGVSTETRDLEQVHRGLEAWFAHREGDSTLTISQFEDSKHSGFSNQTLFFRVTMPNGQSEAQVLRMPPAGVGLFPTYDLEMQWRMQSMLAARGLPTLATVSYEADEKWLGTPFLVMPWLSGPSPDDVTYVLKGWMHDATRDVQRCSLESFADLLGQLHTIEIEDYKDVLRRSHGSGLAAELEWWHDYLLWASDGSPPSMMADAYAWARETSPGNPHPDSILWNDARLSNVVFHSDGKVAGALDWEQASIGPAELDIAFWFGTRRQTCEALGVTADPELPGFPSRSELIARLERWLRRPLHELGWHETFAMVRMGTCIVGTQRVLRLSSQSEHFIMHAPLLPAWALSDMGIHR